ncbi:MAG: alanine:cation symporter family protein, partial [bacterium]|nr:alanine:cation symporter family protein [bacterium]
AFSTMISWSYYGLVAWVYLVGDSRAKVQSFNAVFCIFVALGCMIQLEAVLDFSDALVFLICVPNLFGLYVLAPVVRRRLKRYELARESSPDSPPDTPDSPPESPVTK